MNGVSSLEMHEGRVRGVGMWVGVGRATIFFVFYVFFFFSEVGKVGVPRSTFPPPLPLYLAWQFRHSRYPLDERDMVTARRPFGAAAVGHGSATHTPGRETTCTLVCPTRQRQKRAPPLRLLRESSSATSSSNVSYGIQVLEQSYCSHT